MPDSPLHYPVPWREIASLWRPIVFRHRTNLCAFTASVVAHMDPSPLCIGLDTLPASPRFLVVANHFQRHGMWILHPAAAITNALARHYPGLEPAIRWVVTANWPRWRVGSWEIPSPGDILLPRVAHALWCYAVPFAGTDPRRTAWSFRALLRDASGAQHPIGVFPEGVAGTAATLGAPLPGVERLIALLARAGFAVVPVGISEAGRLVLRFGPPLTPAELLAAPDSARLALARVGQLLRPPHS